MRFLTYVLIVAVALGVGWAWLFGPYWIDYYKMQDVVAAGATVTSTVCRETYVPSQASAINCS